MSETAPNEYLQRLKSTTEAILRDAYQHRNNNLSRGAINWADLHCVAALKVENQDGEVGYRVEIEEVAPDASDLQRFVHERLKEAGFFNIQVYTEW